MEQTINDTWIGLSTEERVLACLAMISDGTTASDEEVSGLGDELIQQVDDDQPVPLPLAYRLFLQKAGAGAGRFLQGSDVFHPHVLGLRETANELLAGSGLALGGTDRVILMHQDSQFDFLRGGGEDPEVWSCDDGNAPTRSHARFTDWLLANVEEQTRAWAHLSHWGEVL